MSCRNLSCTTTKYAFVLLIVFVAPLLLGACAAVVATSAATTGGVAIAQRRSVGAAVDDAVIESRIGIELYSNMVDKSLFLDVDIESVEGRVLLTGSVRKPENRIKAVRLAWQAPGVKEVINEIQVSDTSNLIDYAADVWITTRLRSRITLDEKIRSINYNVETVNGTVYLIGIARDDRELKLVTEYARTIPRVQKVISHVRVENPATT